MHLIHFVFSVFLAIYSTTLLAQSHPSCLSALSDADGDGWGWESGASCIVDATSGITPFCEDTDGDGWGWDGMQTCVVSVSPVVTTPTGSNNNVTGNNTLSACVDSDGDGWGWDGTQTCLMPAGPTITPQGGGPTPGNNQNGPNTACVDDDGDGFGWDGTSTCVASRVPPVPPATTPGVVAGVTDVILMMGQSNALGEDTSVQPNSLDSPDNSIIVWTEFDGWQVADLCSQIWQKGWFPWRGGVCSNHPAFQIAKNIVNSNQSRKVALIPTGMAGKPISWWDDGAIAYVLAKAQAEAALSNLPGHDEVTFVAWSQGEADHGAETIWFNKLNNLISRLRNESWVDSQSTVFIAQETKDSSVNSKLSLFDTDSDSLTHWIPASDLPTKDGLHWSAPALRELGSRYAAKYLSVANL